MWFDHPLRSARASLRRFARDARGATAVEYGLIVALIVIVMVVSLQGLAHVTVDMWNDVNTKVTNAS